MRLIKFRAVADEVAPGVVWSDQTLWAQGPGEPGSAWAGGNRWLKSAGVYPAGSGQLQAVQELPLSGDWLMMDQLSTGGVICVIRARGQETPEIVLLPGMSLQVPGLESLRVVAVPEQSDFVECRLLVGDGVCPITVGPRMPTGQGQPVQIQRRVSGPAESWAHFGNVQAVPAATALPAVVTLATWTGARFGGGRVFAAVPANGDVAFVVGPSVPPALAGVGGNWLTAAAAGPMNVASLSGYALVGSVINGTATAGVSERVMLDDDPGVYVGYPGQMGLHAVLTSSTATTVSACSIIGSVRLRAEAE